MRNTPKLPLLRGLCLATAIALIAVPSLWVIATDVGFGPLVSHILISVSSMFFILFTLLGIRKNNKNSLFCRVCVSIGIAIAALGVWL